VVPKVRVSCWRAVSLTRQLLIFARRDVVHPEVLDVGEVIGGLEELLRRTLGEHIDLAIRTAAGLWPVLADPGQIEQVLVNLAVNARDAMPGGGKLTIDAGNIDVDDAYAATRPDLTTGRYVRLRVSDTGAGMTPRCSHGCSSRSTPPSPRAAALGSAWPPSTASSSAPAVTPRSTPSLASALQSPRCCRLPSTLPPRLPDRRPHPPRAGARQCCCWRTSQP